jgi:voltage-gated potassium channel
MIQDTAENKAPDSFGVLSILIVLLSIYVLGALVVETFFTLPSETVRTLHLLDDAICVVFLIDFGVRFYRAPSKLHFMKWGWIDLISSIPTLDTLRVGRGLRLVRLLRVLRAFRSVRHLINHVYARRSQGAFATVATIAVLMVLFSSIAILQVENAPDSNIRTAEDALWWSYVTVTTVGYGDKYPVTTEGRLIAALLMTTGVGLFGTFTGFLASWFVEDRKKEE